MSVFVQTAQIAGHKPAVIKGGGSQFLIFIISLHQRNALNENFTVLEFQLVAGQNMADSIDAPVLIAVNGQ